MDYKDFENHLVEALKEYAKTMSKLSPKEQGEVRSLAAALVTSTECRMSTQIQIIPFLHKLLDATRMCKCPEGSECMGHELNAIVMGKNGDVDAILESVALLESGEVHFCVKTHTEAPPSELVVSPDDFAVLSTDLLSTIDHAQSLLACKEAVLNAHPVFSADGEFAILVGTNYETVNIANVDGKHTHLYTMHVIAPLSYPDPFSVAFRAYKLLKFMDGRSRPDSIGMS